MKNNENSAGRRGSAFDRKIEPRPATAISAHELLPRVHPHLARWFREAFAAFTHAQLLCVPAVLDRQSILLTSPTGSGKTLAGFLGVFDFLLRKLEKECRNDALRRSRTSRRDVPTSVQCIYVSPLRALAYDIEKNLRSPIVGMGLNRKLSIHLRTGDTTQA